MELRKFALRAFILLSIPGNSFADTLVNDQIGVNEVDNYDNFGNKGAYIQRYLSMNSNNLT